MELKLSWREASPPNHLDGKVDSDQKVVNKELSLFEGFESGLNHSLSLSTHPPDPAIHNCFSRDISDGNRALRIFLPLVLLAFRDQPSANWGSRSLFMD